MAGDLHSLIRDGLADALGTLPNTGRVLRGGAAIATGSLVLTETAAQYTVELGGALYTVTAKATLPKSAATSRPRGGDRLAVDGGLTYLILSCTTSAWDDAYYLNLTTV